MGSFLSFVVLHPDFDVLQPDSDISGLGALFWDLGSGIKDHHDVDFSTQDATVKIPMNAELQLFVKEGLAKGLSRQSLHEALQTASWPKDDIDAALSYYADVDFPIPVPKRKPYLSAREAFMYLVLFLTLYISSISFGTLIFQFINRWLPDPALGLYYYDGSADIIRSATAALIITFPIFLFVSQLLSKAMGKDPEKRASKVRKWLTYITLFIAAGVIIGDLISLVTNVLAGELTPRFVLKSVTVFVIAGSIFGYYLWDLRQEEKES